MECDVEKDVITISNEEYAERVAWLQSAGQPDMYSAMDYRRKGGRSLEYVDGVIAQQEIQKAIQDLESAGVENPRGNVPWTSWDVAYHRWYPTATQTAQDLGATNWQYKGDEATMGVYVVNQGLVDRLKTGAPLLTRAFGQ